MTDKVVTINGVEAREMSLEEFVRTLPEGHRARNELVGMRDELVRFSKVIQEQKSMLRRFQKEQQLTTGGLVKPTEPLIVPAKK